MHLEETVKESLEDIDGTSTSTPSTPCQATRSQSKTMQQTPGTSTNTAITDESRCDYIVYTIRNSLNEVIAVLVETKMRSHKNFQHAVAQVSLHFPSFFCNESL